MGAEKQECGHIYGLSGDITSRPLYDKDELNARSHLDEVFNFCPLCGERLTEALDLK